MSQEVSEDAIWEIVRTHLESATPRERHIFAARSNYDGNSRAVQWMVDNPQLDRATALLLFWYLGGGSYVRFASEDDVPDWQRDDYAMVRTIEQRFCDGFYTQSALCYDPYEGDVSPAEDARTVVRRPIPEIMFKPVEGGERVDVDDRAYDEGLPMAVAERISALFD